MSGVLSSAGTAIDSLGIRRSRLGRKMLSALNMIGARTARYLYLRADAPVLVDGHRLLLADRRGPSLNFIDSLVRNEYEPETKALLLREIAEGMTVLDVGAHVGHYSLLAARQVGPLGHVYAFEPEPDNYAILQRNVAANGYMNVTCIQSAVADRVGELLLHVSKQGNDRHSVVGSSQAVPDSEACVVRTTTLDHFCAALGWPRVDVIKMDIEGAEPLAIEGLTELASRSERLTLVLEFAPEILRAGGTAPSAFLARLGALGFAVEPVERDVPALAPETMALALEQIERRGAINLVCRKRPRPIGA